jgi:hypothetical protein
MIQYKKNFKRASLIAAIFNIAASLVMVFFLKPGLDPAIEIGSRLAYISQNQNTWILCWGLWILAATSLIYFFVQWGLFLFHTSRARFHGLTVFGMFIGCLGMIPDTIAEVLYITVFTHYAKLNVMSVANEIYLMDFYKWEHINAMLTGFLGNGFYCIGGLSLSIVSLSCIALPKIWSRLSLPIWLFGFSLSGAAILQSQTGLIVTTALTMGTFCLWTGTIGLFLRIEE